MTQLTKYVNMSTTFFYVTYKYAIFFKINTFNNSVVIKMSTQFFRRIHNTILQKKYTGSQHHQSRGQCLHHGYTPQLNNGYTPQLYIWIMATLHHNIIMATHHFAIMVTNHDVWSLNWLNHPRVHKPSQQPREIFTPDPCRHWSGWVEKFTWLGRSWEPSVCWKPTGRTHPCNVRRHTHCCSTRCPSRCCQWRGCYIPYGYTYLREPDDQSYPL